MATELLQLLDLVCGTLYQFNCTIQTPPTDFFNESWGDTLLGTMDVALLWLLICSTLEKHLLTYFQWAHRNYKKCKELLEQYDSNSILCASVRCFCVDSSSCSDRNCSCVSELLCCPDKYFWQAEDQLMKSVPWTHCCTSCSCISSRRSSVAFIIIRSYTKIYKATASLYRGIYLYACDKSLLFLYLFLECNVSHVGMLAVLLLHA